RAGKRNLHHVFRKVTGWVQHVLVRGGDVATGSVVVSAEVSSDTTPFRSTKQQRQIDLALVIDDRLRGFDHHLKLQTTFRKIRMLLQTCEHCRKRRDLFGDSDLRQRDDEVVRQTSVI